MIAAETVLVVDDEPSIRLLMHDFLTSLGFRVLVAPDVPGARATLAAETVHLVLSDVNMPGATGLDLLQEITRGRPEIPMIIMTGQPSLKAAVECIKVGAVDYLPKPLDLAKLGGIVSRALATRAAVMVTQTVPLHSSQSIYSSGMGAYNIVSILGRGNMGIVLLAEKQKDGQKQQYAIKMLKPALMDGDQEEREKWLQRFNREAECASRIKHRGVVEVVEYDILGGDQIPYLVMEYCEGMPLSRWMENNQTADWHTKTDIIRQVAEALDSTHEHGICHGDVKPANIMVDQQLNTKLGDFGIAQAIDMTASATVMGTPLYMAPEAFAASRSDYRSDIFSLGVVFYELLVGKRPFSADTLPGVIHAVCHCEPKEPRKIREDLPPLLGDIVGRMLRKSVSERYQSAADVARDVSVFLAGLHVRPDEN